MVLETGAAAAAAEAPSESVSTPVESTSTPAEAPPAEAAKPEESAPPAPKKDPDSAKFAALARREKAAQEAAQRVKQAEQQLQQRQAEIDARFKEFEERDRKAREGRPLDRLKAMGLSPEDVNRDLLGGYTPPEPDPVDVKLSPLQQQMEELRKQNEELRKQVEAEAQQARQHKAHQDYLKFVDAVKQTVDLHGDKYEYVALNGKDAVDLVQEVMIKHYQDNNGSLLSYEEALDLVEDHYESQAERFAKAKKLQTKFAAPQQQKPQEPPAKAKDEPVTLTADMSAASHENVDITKMSEREQLAYIAKLMTLKK